jgi:hypothetical protein
MTTMPLQTPPSTNLIGYGRVSSDLRQGLLVEVSAGCLATMNDADGPLGIVDISNESCQASCSHC